VPASHHRTWVFLNAPPGAPLLPARRGFLLCPHCWSALDSPACLADHMDAQVARTVVPLTQADACAASPGYEGLAPLLAATAAPVRGAPGAFVATAGDGGALVLAGARLGAFPALTEPALAALGLAVVAGLRLASW
jgi:hypothetical protein